MDEICDESNPRQSRGLTSGGGKRYRFVRGGAVDLRSMNSASTLMVVRSSSSAMMPAMRSTMSLAARRPISCGFLPHRGEWRVHRFGEVEVGETDDGEVARDREVEFFGGLVDELGFVVGDGEHGGGFEVVVQNLAGDFEAVAALGIEVPAFYLGFGAAGDGGFETAAAFDGPSLGWSFAAGEAGDAAVAEVEQMFGDD